MTQLLSSGEISIFHLKSATFVISGDTDIGCILIHNLIKILINMVKIVMMSVKLATLGLL